MLDWARDIFSLVEDVIVSRSVEQSQHRHIWDGQMVVVCWFCIKASIDLFALGAVQVPDFQAEAGRLDEDLGKCRNGDVVGFTLRRFNVVCAVGLDIAHGDKVSKVVCMRLHPGTGKELEVGDDGHGDAHVVEGLEQDVVGSAVHCAQRVGQLAQEVKGFFAKVEPNVARVANGFEQVAHGVEAGFFILELGHVGDAQQGLKVGEGNGSPAAVAIAATGAKVGVFCGQGGRLDSIDGIGVGVLGGDGSAALALADKRARGLGLIFAREFLQMGKLLVRGQVGGVGHGEVRGAAVLVLVLVLASVLVVKAHGSEDRGAHG